MPRPEICHPDPGRLPRARCGERRCLWAWSLGNQPGHLGLDQPGHTVAGRDELPSTLWLHLFPHHHPRPVTFISPAAGRSSTPIRRRRRHQAAERWLEDHNLFHDGRQRSISSLRPARSSSESSRPSRRQRRRSHWPTNPEQLGRPQQPAWSRARRTDQRDQDDHDIPAAASTSSTIRLLCNSVDQLEWIIAHSPRADAGLQLCPRRSATTRQTDVVAVSSSSILNHFPRLPTPEPSRSPCRELPPVQRQMSSNQPNSWRRIPVPRPATRSRLGLVLGAALIPIFRPIASGLGLMA